MKQDHHKNRNDKQNEGDNFCPFFVNFFIECLINEEKTIIFFDSWRSIIGVDDVFKLSKELIFNHNNKVLKFSNIETII